MIKKKLIQITEPVYKSAIACCLGYSFDELNDLMRRHNLDEIESSYRGSLGLAVTQQDENGLYFNTNWFPIKNWTISAQGILVHESAHLVFNLHKQKGIEIYKDDNNETFCYLQEYYFKEICIAIIKHLNKKKKKPQPKKRGADLQGQT